LFQIAGPATQGEDSPLRFDDQPMSTTWRPAPATSISRTCIRDFLTFAGRSPADFRRQLSHLTSLMLGRD